MKNNQPPKHLPQTNSLFPKSGKNQGGWPKKNGRSANLSPLLILPVSLLVSSTMVLAQLTPAGTRIENEATGTFADPTTGQTTNVTSNKVFLTVAEVAGITVTPAGVTEVDGSGNIAAGDLIYFDFNITNVGNDPSRVRVPNNATVTGPGILTTPLQVSLDGGKTWTNISGNEFISDSLAPGQSIRVRVPVTANQDATPGSILNVKLGNTPNNTQNQPRTPEDNDVYTVDNPDTGVVGEVPGAPINGTREASNTQTLTIGSPSQALPAIYKTLAQPVSIGNPADPTDDRLTYNLALEARRQIPGGVSNILAADLTGTPITVNNAQVTRILVSDVVPTNTVLTGTWTTPPGWQLVYTRDDPKAINAIKAQWYTEPTASPIGGLANVTRIGYIFEGTVPKGTTVTGFSFQVVTANLTTTTNVANIAQVFGASPGSPNRVIYDESGDQNPANYNDDGTPPPVDSTGNPIIPDGVPNPSTQGVDPGNNSGIGPGGEVLVYTVTSPTGALVNGPQGNPSATGPTDNNDDFINKSVVIPPGVSPNAPIDPAPVGFTNSVQNTSNTPINITLLPTRPANPNDLPAGTKVTITYGGRSVVYTYDPATGFTSPDTPIVIPNVGPNQSVNYNVTIDLPNSQQLKGYPVPITSFIDSDGDGKPGPNEPKNTVINRVYTGFIRVNKETRILQGSGPVVPTGQDQFSTDTKNPAPGNIIEFRISYSNISETGPTGNVTLKASNITITEDGTTLDLVSNPSGNSWALDNDDADKDGNPTTGIDTSNVIGSATDSAGGNIRFFNGRPANNSVGDITGTTLETDVTKYVVQITNPLIPQQSGTFSFKRKVN